MVNLLEMFTLYLLINLCWCELLLFMLSNILLLFVFVCDRKPGSREYEIYYMEKQHIIFKKDIFKNGSKAPFVDRVFPMDFPSAIDF
jgi:hypothetical protein